MKMADHATPLAKFSSASYKRGRIALYSLYLAYMGSFNAK